MCLKSQSNKTDRSKEIAKFGKLLDSQSPEPGFRCPSSTQKARPVTSALRRQIQADPWNSLESASSWVNDETLSQKEI